MGRLPLSSRVAAFLTGLFLLVTPAVAAPNLVFSEVSENEDLDADLRQASLTVAAIEEEQTDPANLVSATLADYRRLIETLYAYGHYSGSVSIKMNGREVASMSLLSLPAQITSIEIVVDPGPLFTFGETSVGPLAPGETVPEEFLPGQPALATIIQSASRSAVVGWREAGHAKAQQGSQRVVADHRAATLSADLDIVPGPRVRFGDLIIKGQSAVRRDKLEQIADMPTGEVFSPGELSDLATRLRRTGTFGSVTLREGPVNPDGTMDVELTVADRKPRRYGVGAELSSFEGLDLSAFWLHRNLFGGG